jgi:hypothetical protein
MTDYTPEQRALRARLGDISKRIRATVAEQDESHIVAATGITGAAQALAAAIERSNRISPLFTEYVDAFNEFVDSL